MLDFAIYKRPPMSRNRYGWINNGGTSVYSSNSLYNSMSPVGDSMVDVTQLSDFIGATNDTAGQRGVVPAPDIGQNNWYYLRGNGSWDFIPAAKWLYEWPKDLEPSGLGIDGNFHVSDTLSTLNLNVEGRAHFWELVIDKAKANGGQIMVSPSLFQIDYVDNVVTYSTVPTANELFSKINRYRPDITKWINRYNLTKCRAQRVWMKNDDGVDRTFSEVEIGDMLRCRTFNLDGHAGFEGTVMKDVANTDYWTFVCGVGSGTFTVETEDGEQEFDGLYVDLAFALTGTNQEYHYVPINTLFIETDDGDWQVTLPENFMMPDIYDELKQWTFNTLCGSMDVETEYVENEDTKDDIIDADFRIRGIGYITAQILGAEYVDDSYSSLFSILESSNIAGYILYGSDSDSIQGAVQKILGVDVEPYGDLAAFEMNYATDIVDETVNGNTGFEYSQDGQYDPQFTYDKTAAAQRREWMFGYGVFEPRVGQQLACLGHLYDTDRQNAIVISSIQPIDPELISPSIAQYSGIDIFGTSISQFRLSVLAKNGNILTGKFMVKNNGAYISVDDMIDMYITDIETGLETVGIHLDGARSTIRMKGSVELHQHSNKDDDTLSVWNSQEIKKLEIVPTNIPSRGEVDQTNETPYTNNKTTAGLLPASKDSVKWSNKSDQEANWWQENISGNWHWEYRYSVAGGANTVTITDTVKLGSYAASDVIDVSNVNLQISLGSVKLQGYYPVDLYTYGNNITYTVTLRQAEYGERITKSYSPNNLAPNMQDFNILVGDFVDDYTVHGSGTNRWFFYLDISATFYVWTNSKYYQSKTNYSSPLFTENIRSTFSAKVISTSQTNNFMTIGTNGLVYSVGNGDYFYAGNDGFEYKYKDNRIVMADSEFKVMHKPQIINPDNYLNTNRIKSEVVFCQNTGSPYSISMPIGVESGRRFTIFGYKGLRINSWDDKRFKVYRNDLDSYGTYNAIVLSNVTEIVPASSGSDAYVKINCGAKIELITLDDGIYILSTIF